jgi:hypothetical protein
MKALTLKKNRTAQTFTDSTGMEWPTWCERARKSPPPELRGDSTTAAHQAGNTRGGNKTGTAPGFKVTQHQMDTDGYLWFTAVRGDDASRMPALVRPYTYFHAVGAPMALKVPVTVLNMAYREAAMLARRVSRCPESGLTVHGRDPDTKNERVWYHVGPCGHVWVGVRLSTLTDITRAEGVDYVPMSKVPVTNWTTVQWS